MSTHTPELWDTTQMRVSKKKTKDRSALNVHLYGVNWDDHKANARLISAAPDLLAACIQAYGTLADINNNWPGRHTMAGQRLLCEMRGAISEATGIDRETIQNGGTS